MDKRAAVVLGMFVLALWDGEEFGLLGSTEWDEKHQEELSRKAVVYINSDTNSKGAISASGSHTLERFMSEVRAAGVMREKASRLVVVKKAAKFFSS